MTRTSKPSPLVLNSASDQNCHQEKACEVHYVGGSYKLLGGEGPEHVHAIALKNEKARQDMAYSI